MSKTVLVISPQILTQIYREGAAAYPNECCGIMIGIDEEGPQMTRRVVQRLEAVPNVFDEKEQYHRFSIDPKTLMDADKRAGAEGKLVLGFYHSHPDVAARPSEYDREHAWPFYSYAILSVLKGIPAEMKSWQLDSQTEQFSAEDIFRH